MSSTTEADEWANFGIPLADNIDVVAQLKTEIHKNISEDDEHIPRDLVTAQDLGHFYFHVRCRRPRVGTFTMSDGKTVPACLVVFEFEFTKTMTNSRFRKAKVTIDFLDKPAALLDPHEQDDRITDLQPPKVLDFEPRMYHTKVNEARGSTTGKLEISASGPGVTAGGGFSRTDPFIKSESAKVEAHSRGRPPSTVIVGLEEDKLTAGGIIPRFAIPTIVEYVPGRVFAARIVVQIDLAWWKVLRPVHGRRDDPVWFDAERLQDDSHKDTDVLDGLGFMKLREMTGLAQYGGTFLRA